MGDDLRAGPVRGQSEPSFGVQVCSQAQRSWVTLRGELDLTSAPHLQQVLDQLCRDGYPEIVLDLSGLEFLSAAGLTVFLRVDDHQRTAHGRLILHRPGRRARRVLAITGLDTVLTIRPATARSLTCDPQRGRRPVLANEGGLAVNQPASPPPDARHHTDRRRAKTTRKDTATTKDASGQLPPGDMAATTPVLAVVWCRSVGTCWTLELHQLRRGTPHTTLVDWISSGVPIWQPEPPEALARTLLAERGLQLFGDCFAGPCTGTRHGIGYASSDAELIALAHLVADHAPETGRHPVMLAAQWIAAGFSAEAVARWIRQGVHSPSTTQHTTPPQPTRSPPHTTGHSIRPPQLNHQP